MRICRHGKTLPRGLGSANQTPCMASIAERRIEDNLRFSARGREINHGALARCIPASRKYDAVLSSRSGFHQCEAKKLPDPLRGGVDCDAVPCGIYVVFGEKRSRVIRIQHIPKAACIFGEIVPTIGFKPR